MAKRKPHYKPDVKVREAEPRVGNEKQDAQILCPFCTPPHPIAIGQMAACGTSLMIKAVQVIYPSRTVNKRNLICLKCKKGGGEMVQFNLGYVHLHECTPGTKLLAEQPEYSRWARIVYGMPAWMKAPIEARKGKARQIKEVTPEGKDTGQVLGYFFYRDTGGPHAIN